MIDGLKLEMTSADLVAHIAARRDYHRDRTEWYAGQIAALRDGGLRPENISNDPVSSLERSKAEHENKAGLFAFMVEHVVPNETYRLSESDLARIEVLNRW